MAEELPESGPHGFGLTRRNMLIGGLLVCASGVSFARQPRIAYPLIDDKKFEDWVPRSFGNWRTAAISDVVLPPPDGLRDRLYDDLVTRTYAAPDQSSVMLLLAYNNAQDGVLQVHRPEICYPVGGFALSNMRAIDFTGMGRKIPAKMFTAAGPNRTEQVAYFTRLGKSFPRSWVQQRLAVMAENLQGRIPDGMMMRVSLLGVDPGGAQATLDAFAREFIAAADPRLRKLLLG